MVFPKAHSIGPSIISITLLSFTGSIVSITDGAARVSDVTSWFPTAEEDESYIGKYAVFPKVHSIGPLL